MNELEKELPYYRDGISAKTTLYVVFSDTPEITSLDAWELFDALADNCDLREHPFDARECVNSSVAVRYHATLKHYIAIVKANQLDHYIACEWINRGVAVHYYTTLERARALHPTLPLSESLQESLDYP